MSLTGFLSSLLKVGLQTLKDRNTIHYHLKKGCLNPFKVFRSLFEVNTKISEPRSFFGNIINHLVLRFCINGPVKRYCGSKITSFLTHVFTESIVEMIL